MMPVIYWTDGFIYIFCILLIFSIIRYRKNKDKHQISFWIFKKMRYRILLGILCIYGVIGLLDTVHFKVNSHNHHVKSLLDVILSPWDTAFEKTYSAPFAKTLYTPEVVVKPDGSLTELYPLLKYPGQHWLGTDKAGRDVFYMTLKSIRTGLVIGIVTTLIMLPFALFLGMWAGYFRGWVDDVIQYVYTTLSSIPGILLIAAGVVAFQTRIQESADLRLLLLCVVLGVTSWIGLCRLLRGETLKIKENDYVQAAIVLGGKHLKIIRQHVLPNLMHIVIITVVLDFSGLVLAEAILSYVGVGVDPASFSWGNMINAARLEMAREPIVWWSLLGALSFMFMLVFSANIVSEALAIALDPKRRQM